MQMKAYTKRGLWLAASSWWWLASAGAATITVDTDKDEDNGRTSNMSGENFPLSQGCSLREALQAVANNDGLPHRGCTAATVDGPNTIQFDGDYTIVINSQVPDPADVNGMAMKRNGILPNVTSTPGPLVIDGAGHNDALGCEAGATMAEAAPKILDVKNGAQLTIDNLGFKDCTAAGSGIAITATGADLVLNTVSFSNIHSSSGGSGGAVNFTGPAALSMIDVVFDNNGTQDTGMNPSNGLADGGALWLSGIANVAGQNMGDPPVVKPVNLTNVTFTRNSAAHNGGAIYVNNAGGSLGYTIQMTNVLFGGPLLGNTAKGGLQADGATPNGEDGGGAVWIRSSNGHGAADLFLMNACQFLGNSAPNGYGGAILLSFDSTLTLQAAGQEIPPIISGAPPLPVPIGLVGGIFGSNFAGNSAGGDPNDANSPNAINGSGGAIYSRGKLSVLQSSFVGNSSGKNGGGAIANNGGANNPITLGNVTFNNNTAALDGGAIANFNGAFTLLNDTLAGNTANDPSAGGGGGAIWNNGSAADIQVRNTLLGASGAGGNCVGALTDNGNNLQYMPDTGCGTIAVGDPNLAAASVSPGPNFLVLSMAIQSDHSPAQGTGDEATCEAAPLLRFDITGNPAWRPQGDAACDIGAFESTTTFPVRLQAFEVD
jgi:CSLREA domain-containing protein